MVHDMTSGSATRKLINFALPIILANLFQQLYNIIDLIIIGRYAGAPSMAAVGNCSNITFIFVAVATGIASGENIVVASHFGAREMGKVKSCIWTSIIIGISLGVLLMGLGVAMHERIFIWLKAPNEIRGYAEAYFIRYLIGLPFLFLFNIVSNAYQALGDSQSSLYILVTSTLVNIILDFLFVANFHMGVKGAADATIIAEFVSMIIGLYILQKRINLLNTTEDSHKFDKREIKEILYIGIPSMLQSSSVGIGLILMQPLVNQFGTLVIAAFTSSAKIDSLARVPMMGVGSAVSVFVAQNMGAGKKERLIQGLKIGLLLDILITAVICFGILWQGTFLLKLFITGEEAERVVSIGINYLKIISAFFILQGFMNTIGGYLKGVQDMFGYFAYMTLNVLARLISAYVLVEYLQETGIWLATPIGWGVGLIVVSCFYIRDRRKLITE